MVPIYLDHAATTPVRDEVREAMASVLESVFGNPSSTHSWGRRAAATLDEARRRVADAVGAQRGEIYFVRGGTESDNLAILGMAEAARERAETPRVVVSAIEHKAVLDASAQVERRGGQRTVLPVLPDGTLDLDVLDQALADHPAVVSVMMVNNEVGIRLPVAEVVARAHEAGVPVHSDAVQALGKVPVRVDETEMDLLSLTGHKIYGAKGTGMLFVREGIRISPLIFGGGQERGLRPGTEDVAGAVGMSVAVELAVREQREEAERLAGLRDALEARLREGIADLRVHGETAPRAPHITNVGIPGVDPEALLMALDMEGVAASAGSACESGAGGGSHVLEALYGPMDGMAALRFSLGRSTTLEDTERAAQVTRAAVERIKSRAEVA